MSHDRTRPINNCVPNGDRLIDYDLLVLAIYRDICYITVSLSAERHC